MPGLFGGGKQKTSGGGGGGGGGSAPGPKLFTPEQVAKATKDYTSQGTAKWGQILANMGAGGGTGGDLSTAISDQAKQLGTQLGGLTDSSGYGSDGMSQLSNIMASLEKGMNAKYSVY